jgi:hypothetical protein
MIGLAALRAEWDLGRKTPAIITALSRQPSDVSTRRLVARILLTFVAFGAAAIARSQPSTEAPAGSADPAQPPDEIVVRGRRLEQMRLEVQAAREHVYELFSACNGDDQFDIRCSDEQRTGTRARRRVCTPQYADTENAEAGQELVRRWQDACPDMTTCDPAVLETALQNANASAQENYARIRYMDGRLDEEMRRVLREDPEVAAAFLDYAEKEFTYQDASKRRRSGD